jgi:hypothetical protein
LSDHTHYDVLQRVIERLKEIDLSPVLPSQIYAADFPFDSPQSPGIACSEVTEVEGVGTNERDDYMYGVQLTRIFGGTHRDYHKDRSSWRTKVRKAFHRQLMGGIDCEIVTKIEPATITLSREWKKNGIDASVIRIWCWVRETRGLE